MKAASTMVRYVTFRSNTNFSYYNSRIGNVVGTLTNGDNTCHLTFWCVANHFDLFKTGENAA